ncbi:MAG: sigma-70 family RNA polymerase sigma factor [Enterococcus sp.]|nr:sigma-70 family RNA polymerase sigma factor [Enterococcus sp.]
MKEIRNTKNNNKYNKSSFNGEAGSREALIKETRSYIKGMVSRHYSYLGKEICEDLIQEGMTAAWIASEKFDTSFKAKFTTYAYNYIQGAFNDFFKENRFFKISDRANGDLIKISRVINNFKKSIDYDPSLEEIAEITGLSVSRVNVLLPLRNKPMLLDNAFPFDDDEEFGRNDRNEVDLESDAFADDPMGNAKNVKKTLIKGLATLSERERIALVNYVGYYCKPKNLKEIAKIIGVGTEQRAGQIVKEAKKKLAANQTLKALAA